MNQMHTKNPMIRMVNLSQVRSHIWFKDFNWEDLVMLNMIPHYKPMDSFEKKKLIFSLITLKFER